MHDKPGESCFGLKLGPALRACDNNLPLASRKPQMRLTPGAGEKLVGFPFRHAHPHFSEP